MHHVVYTTKPNKDSLPGFYESNDDVKLSTTNKIKIPGVKFPDAFIIENVLSDSDCKQLLNVMNTSDNFEDVGIHGTMDVDDKSNIGSKRTSIWSPNIANEIWNKINQYLDPITGNNHVLTDWWQGLPDVFVYNNIAKYKPVAISPLMRFMKYENNGQHYAHYDASYIYTENRYRTLKSVVIYLTTNDNAATRFIDDKQTSDIWTRNHNDWDREVEDNEIIGISNAVKGNILVFDHRMCHDVQKYFGNNERIIIRTDVVYKLNTVL